MILRPALLLLLAAAVPAARAQAVAWETWSEAAFARARAERRFVILDLEAGWCHWCHVMDATTYRDPGVTALLGARFVAVRVDEDSRPDLANRYEDYGWPATVIFGPDGAEIVRKRGYLPPSDMARLLRAVIEDPTPVGARDSADAPRSTGVTGLSDGRRAALRAQWAAGYDEKAGGWGFSHKYLDWDNVELAMRDAALGDAAAARRARDTLRLQRRLVDPVWGGVYQYSVGGGWDEPHFEKIVQMQAGDLRIYAQAYAQWADPRDLATAAALHRYLRAFLTSPDGAFYVSQDADLGPDESGEAYYALDDAGRRARGLPRVDTHCYARENGWVIAALARLAAATGDESARREAEAAARWVLRHRALAGGGFSHDERDAAGPYLDDTLSMGRAFLALHELTADPSWLARATAAADFIRLRFGRSGAPGFCSSDATRPVFPEPRPQFDENTGVVRFGVALAQRTGRVEYRAMASTALRWLLSPGLAEGRGFYVAGLLLAEEEARTDPLHIAILGRKDDPRARDLFATALRAPTAHRLIEWWDRREGPAPRGEALYPRYERAAAFVCSNGACSAPIFDAGALAARLHLPASR